MSSSEKPVQEHHGDTGVSPAPIDPPREGRVPVLKDLPEIPMPDLSFDLSSILGPSNPEEEKVQKRASSVLKLARENERLQAELKAMTERIEAAERRRAQLAEKEQKIMEEPSS
ncbi:unnamed protein product [Cyclocybe aegerita]|uniref:Uncharacterized protein n=1 Tax=Cyclocybe aegerita TaxID=1973307 RepID=A0A8S0X2J5_CYCAE|nr:unnamed protein product [Cyclocybe aegerita]